VSEAKPPPEDSDISKAEAMALLEEAEAEAAEAEAEAAAARARARAARLRREALEKASEKAKEKAKAAEAEKRAADAKKDDKDKEDKDDAVESVDADDTVESVDGEIDEEEPDETVTAGEVAEVEPRPARRRRRLPSLSLSAISKAAAIILICAFTAATGYMMWQDHDATERAQRAASFVAGARQGIINMTSLDFNRAKEDVQRVIDSSTGSFRDDFAQRAKDFTSVVEQSKVVTQGTVSSAALESMDEHSASVLILATSKITNAAGAKDEPRIFRLRVTVTEDGGQYKMSKVDFVV
jgi:Mce-associated membrane protein